MIKVYKKNIFNNVNLDEVNKILNAYISTHYKKFHFCFLKCEYVIEFDNNSIANINSSYFYKTDIINKNRYLLYDIDCFKSKGSKFYNINQMTVNSISDRCNMTYENYTKNLMHMVESRLNLNVAKNPSLINSFDRNKKHPLIRKNLTYHLINNDKL